METTMCMCNKTMNTTGILPPPSSILTGCSKGKKHKMNVYVSAIDNVMFHSQHSNK